MIVRRKTTSTDIDLKEVRDIIKSSLEKSLEILTLTLSDHRYHQGMVATLKDLDKLIQTP